MKKFYLLITLTVLSIFNVKAQIAYHDAIKLAKEVNNDSIYWQNQNAMNILSLYSISKDPKKIAAEFFTNPFIHIDTTGMKNQGNFQTSGVAKLVSKIGGLDVTSYANAISSLMIDRAKQELTVAFFDRMKTFSEKNPEFKILFPKTFDKLSNLLSYSYPQMLPTLRQVFFEDIQQITYNLEAVLLLPKYELMFKDFPEISIVTKMLGLMHRLERGELAAAEIIKEVNYTIEQLEVNFEHPGLKNMATTVHFACLFSESLRSTDADQIWISFDQAFSQGGNNLSDEVVLKIYLGLLWQKVKNMNLEYILDDSKTKSLAELLKDNADNIFLIQNRLKQFLTISEKVQLAYQDIDKKIKGKEAVTPEDFYLYINTSVDAIDYSLGLIKSFNNDLNYTDYLSLVRSANNLYKDIYSQEYTMAVNDAFEIFSDIRQLTEPKLKENKNLEKDTENKVKEFEKFSKKVKPYAIFMANVADAKNEDDIQAALNNAILPVGSSAIKKHTSSNLCIQSYLGAYYSIRNENTEAIRAWSDEFGVYGPIGLAYTPGFLSWGKGGSLSVFGSIFDLGAIIDYQLKQDSSIISSTNPNEEVGITKDYTVNLGQIFLPGVHIVYGLPWNIPLSLGVGAQYGPGLNQINELGEASVLNPTWRLNVFLAVDLPFFNLFNRPK